MRSQSQSGLGHWASHSAIEACDPVDLSELNVATLLSSIEDCSALGPKAQINAPVDVSHAVAVSGKIVSFENRTAARAMLRRFLISKYEIS